MLDVSSIWILIKVGATTIHPLQLNFVSCSGDDKISNLFHCLHPSQWTRHRFSAPLEESRQTFHRPKSALGWENQKTKTTEFDGSNELKDTMKIMKEQHGLNTANPDVFIFASTVNQYKKQLGKWGLDNKRIKDSEYQAMLKKKRKREQEDLQ
ncbi:hypothetical protein MMC29_006403 [Sticta canariensis]|nr:hypothetical protein [Sticta canariensis]